MNLKIKVCGMCTSKNILEVAEQCPDFMGFIFYEKSKRFVGHDFVIPDTFPASVRRVGVFVNESVEFILETVSKHKLDLVQLHGNEPALVCKKLKPEVGVIKAFQVDEKFDFTTTRMFVPFVDFFLFDTKTETYGGSGKSFDWNLLQQYNEVVPFFISGGISTQNTMKINAIRSNQLFAVDVNSGAELSPGLKDIRLIQTIKQQLQAVV